MRSWPSPRPRNPAPSIPSLAPSSTARGNDPSTSLRPPATRSSPAPAHRPSPGDTRWRCRRPEGLPDDLDERVDRLSAQGLTTFVVRRDGDLVGVVAVSDRVRPGAEGTVRRLRDMELEVAMVTGDRRATAQAIASSIGIPRVLAEVLPSGKVGEVARLQAEGHRVVFVGDGINDAPALAQADVGIALGTGTDVAIQAADVSLLGGGIEGVADAVDLARRTYRVIAQNLFWAFAYNVVMIPLAVFGVLTPAWAAAAMAASSVSVVANALRLRRFRRSSRTLESV